MNNTQVVGSTLARVHKYRTLGDNEQEQTKPYK
jgi:hypothetical protein